MPANGNLGKALDYHQNSCETACCSWASFKLARYLTQFTGEARYGDWVERLMYNGVGGILPIKDNGRHFYYADYRVAGGVKVYARDVYTCCSGTYCQAVSDYPNQIYYKDASSLYVSLYLPSEVTWSRADGEVKIVQDTRYPEAETITFEVNDVADNLKRYSSFIPGIRPGRPTADYLAAVMNRVTFAGATFLGFITVILPIVTSKLSGINTQQMYLGGTAILIVVGVALDTMKQLQTQLVMRQYRGFIK